MIWTRAHAATAARADACRIELRIVNEVEQQATIRHGGNCLAGMRMINNWPLEQFLWQGEIRPGDNGPQAAVMEVV